MVLCHVVQDGYWKLEFFSLKTGLIIFFAPRYFFYQTGNQCAGSVTSARDTPEQEHDEVLYIDRYRCFLYVRTQIITILSKTVVVNEDSRGSKLILKPKALEFATTLE